MISCAGWAQEQIGAMRVELKTKALRMGGKAGDFWWSFPPKRRQSEHAVNSSVTRMRSGRRVSRCWPRYPEHDPAMPQRIPNLGMRMVEAAVRASGLPGVEVRAWDLGTDRSRLPHPSPMK